MIRYAVIFTNRFLPRKHDFEIHEDRHSGQMNIAATIIPIFLVICLGWAAKEKGFLPTAFVSPANRLVFYIAIPAMIFRSVATAPFQSSFAPAVLIATLTPVACVFAAAWTLSRALDFKNAMRGTFIQSAVHGNLGYVGLAVAFYYMGETGLSRAGIIAGFLMILQNLFSVIALQYHSPTSDQTGKLGILVKLVGNPVIVSACIGICFSLFGIPIPIVIDRTLKILGGMALPTALLIIGASLSVGELRSRKFPLAISQVLKLVLLPGLGFLLYGGFGLSAQECLPGLILLASPTATITVVMAKEMDGDEELAVGAVSASTLLSMATFALWLGLSK